MTRPPSVRVVLREARALRARPGGCARDDNGKSLDWLAGGSATGHAASRAAAARTRLCGVAALLGALILANTGGDAAAAGGIALGQRVELKHAAKGHEVHVSGPALAIAPDGVPLIAWAAQEGHVNHLSVARMGRERSRPA